MSAAIIAFVATVIIIPFLIRWRWHREMDRNPGVILSGGGTAGHVYPALAIAEGIRRKEPNVRFLYVGVAGKAEEVIARQAGYPIRFITSTGFPGFRPSFSMLRFACKITAGIIQSFIILITFRPRWIIATGGYACAPIVICAVGLRYLGMSPTRVFLHEQNSIPGQLNAFLGRFADLVLLSFPQTLRFFPKNGVVVGYPIRWTPTPHRSRTEARKQLPFAIPENRKVIFVFGGSQGARTINNAVIEALPLLFPLKHRIFIVHGVGLAKTEHYNPMEETDTLMTKVLPSELREELDSFYYRQDYFHNMEDLYAVSDLVVCRSGAGTINEVCLMGKPALLIPKSNLPGDHQVMNARAMKAAGAAEILYEEVTFEDGEFKQVLKGHRLAECIIRLLDRPEKLREMAINSRNFIKPGANERILKVLYGEEIPDWETGTVDFGRFMGLSNRDLLKVLGRAYRSDPDNYEPLRIIEDPDDLEYYRYKAETLLASTRWQERNLGVKLIGLTLHRDRISVLLSMLKDRTPAPWVQRLFGGDYKQVGFIRRNIIRALKILNIMDEEVKNALLIALEDPYYEVRAEVCGAIIHFSSSLMGKERLPEALIAHLKDDSFEVSAEAAKALGEIGTEPRVARVLLDLKEHGNWQVRNGALLGLKRLFERGIIPADIITEIENFILTTPHFVARFPIQETYDSIIQHLRKQEEQKR